MNPRKQQAVISLLILATLLAWGLGYYHFCSTEGVLARYGVHYNPDAVDYESVNLNTARFWFEGPAGQLPGPEVTGDLLVIEHPRLNEEGNLEFSVRTCTHEENNRIWIQLLPHPRGRQAFVVSGAKNSYLSVLYPQQAGLPPGWP